MPAMTYSDALEAVHSLASKLVVDDVDVAFGDPGLAARRRDDRIALDTVGDFVTNHHETVDGLSPPSAGTQWPEGVLHPGGDCDPSHPLDAIRRLLATIEESGLDVGDAGRAAARLVEGLVATHHAELADIRVVDLSPAMR